MKKHPSMLKVLGSLAEKNNSVTDTAVTLFEGKREREGGKGDYKVLSVHRPSKGVMSSGTQ